MASRAGRKLDGFFSYLVENVFLTAEQASELEACSHRKSGLLGRMLLRHRVVTVRQMSEILRVLPGSGLRVGDVAVAMGFAERERVEHVASMQVFPQQRDKFDRLLEMLDRDELFEAMLDYIRVKDDVGRD